MKTLTQSSFTLNQISGSALNVISRLSMTLALFVLALAAEARGSELEISLWNNSEFEIEIDQKSYQSGRTFQIDALSPGKHRIRISQRRQNAYGYGGGGLRVLYNGSINIPNNSLIVAEVRSNKRLVITDSRRLRPQRPTRPVGTCGGGTLGGGNYGNGQGGNTGGYSTIWDTPDNQDDHYGHDYGDTPSCGIMDCQGCSQCQPGWGTSAPEMDCMSNSQLAQLLDAMDRAWYDDDKLRIARQHVRQTHIASHQVRTIMEQFSFESNRLEFAKFAHSRVSDPDNYYLVNDAFDFSCSANELNEFIWG